MCFCWRHWTSSSQVLSINSSLTTFSVKWKKTTSEPSSRRSERTRSYCQCSVASRLNNSNGFSMRWSSLDRHMSATLSPTDQVCRYLVSYLLIYLLPLPLYLLTTRLNRRLDDNKRDQYSVLTVATVCRCTEQLRPTACPKSQ